MNATVTFVTLFLSLVSGQSTVEVAVEGPVASVEIRLDGWPVGVAKAPEWQTTCDFGSDIQPHRLEAIAKNEQGNELARTEQTVNLPKPLSEVRILLDRDDAGTVRGARIVGQNATLQEPIAVSVNLDGVPVQEASSEHYPLPAYDPMDVHLLAAEARFPNGDTASTVTSFGGSYTGEVHTELTAVPIVMSDKGRPPTAGDLQGVFSARGATVKVAAVARRGMRIFLVQDCTSTPQLLAIDSKSYHVWDFPENPDELMPPDIHPDALQLGVTETFPKQRGRLLAFPVTAGIDMKKWDIPWVVLHLFQKSDTPQYQKLADATAVAGIMAARSARPRAVVLILGDGTDASNQPPKAVRNYLRSLHVPLHVWSPHRDATTTSWGEAVEISSVLKLKKASRRLKKEISRQWIVWLEGTHLPNEVELAQGAGGIRLAGASGAR